jgi:hypothetical protein
MERARTNSPGILAVSSGGVERDPSPVTSGHRL